MATERRGCAYLAPIAGTSVVTGVINSFHFALACLSFRGGESAFPDFPGCLDLSQNTLETGFENKRALDQMGYNQMPGPEHHRDCEIGLSMVVQWSGKLRRRRIWTREGHSSSGMG